MDGGNRGKPGQQHGDRRGDHERRPVGGQDVAADDRHRGQRGEQPADHLLEEERQMEPVEQPPEYKSLKWTDAFAGCARGIICAPA